jgi:hypothetical protein
VSSCSNPAWLMISSARAFRNKERGGKGGWPGCQPWVRLRSKNTAESHADEPVPPLGRGNRNAGDQRIDNRLYEAQHLLHADAGLVLRLGSCHCCPFGIPDGEISVVRHKLDHIFMTVDRRPVQARTAKAKRRFANRFTS